MPAKSSEDKQLFDYENDPEYDPFYKLEKMLLSNESKYLKQKRSGWLTSGKKNISEALSSEGRQLFDHKGVRAVLSKEKSSDGVMNISVSFMATIDWKSKFLNLDLESPGVSQIKAVEKQLLKELYSFIEEKNKLSEPVKLNILGQSLGGALAQAFTEALMRKIDLDQASTKISSINLYTRSSPKTSMRIAESAQKLSQCEHMPKICVYHQQHKDINGKLDWVVGTGEAMLGTYPSNDKMPVKKLVIDCKTDNKSVRKKWNKGLLGDCHMGGIFTFYKKFGKKNKNFNPKYRITSGHDQFSITPRSDVRKLGFYVLNRMVVPIKAIRNLLFLKRGARKISNSMIQRFSSNQIKETKEQEAHHDHFNDIMQEELKSNKKNELQYFSRSGKVTPQDLDLNKSDKKLKLKKKFNNK